MAEGARPSVSTIPPHRAFVDALAAGLLARAGDDPMVLARELVLLPNNRPCRALSDAFVRRLGTRGLLLPRMAPIGGLALDEAVAVAFDDLGHAAEIPAAIDGCARRLMLAPLVQRFGDLVGRAMGAAEAVRLAGQLARPLDPQIGRAACRE